MRFDLTVSQFAWELATGRPLQVYDADTWRPYCHVRDICKAIMTMLTSAESVIRGEVFNVGDTSQQFTKRMVVDEVRRHVRDLPVTYGDGAPTRATTACHSTRSRDRLDFRCDHTVQDYLARLTLRYRQASSRTWAPTRGSATADRHCAKRGVRLAVGLDLLHRPTTTAWGTGVTLRAGPAMPTSRGFVRDHVLWSGSKRSCHGGTSQRRGKSGARQRAAERGGPVDAGRA